MKKTSLMVSAFSLSACVFIAGCGQTITNTETDPYRVARADNLNRHVASTFQSTPMVIADRSGSGVETSQLFFTSSDTVVVSSGDIADQVRAASIAVVQHAPMLTMTDSTREEVVAEIGRLGASYILEVGDVPLATASGDEHRIKDPGGIAALGEMTAVQFHPKAITYPSTVIRAVTELDPNGYDYLIPGWDEDTYREAIDTPARRDTSRPKVEPFPAQARRDAGMAPIVIASEQSSVASVATAKAYGATVRAMRYPDPRFSRDSMATVAGLSDQPLIALGSQFGTGEQLSRVIQLGEKVTTPIAGSGGLVFPGRTIAAVSADSVDVSSILEAGEQVSVENEDSPSQSRSQSQPQSEADALVQAAKQTEALVARHVDGTVEASIIADAHMADDPAHIETLAEVLDAITDKKGYGFVRFTPKAGKLGEQLTAISPLLHNPNVGVMVDLTAAANAGTGLYNPEPETPEDGANTDNDQPVAPEYAVADPRISSQGFAGGSTPSDEGTTPRDLHGQETTTNGANPNSHPGDDDITNPEPPTAPTNVAQGWPILDADEINSTLDQLARFIDTNSLPQKAFVIAQNAPGMVTDLAKLDPSSPHIAFTVVAQPAFAGDATTANWESAKKGFGAIVSEYQQLRKEIFFGWGLAGVGADLGSFASLSPAAEGEELQRRWAEFAQLSPRPWLIINS